MSNLIQIEITEANVEMLRQLSLGETADKKLQIFDLNRQITQAQQTITECENKIAELEG